MVVSEKKVFLIDGKGFLSDKSCYNTDFLSFLKHLCKTRSLYVTPPLAKFKGEGTWFCAVFFRYLTLGFSFSDIITKLKIHDNLEQLAHDNFA